jgi:hypothetical protein
MKYSSDLYSSLSFYEDERARDLLKTNCIRYQERVSH